MEFDRLELVRIKNALLSDNEIREAAAREHEDNAPLLEMVETNRRLIQRIETHLAR